MWISQNTPPASLLIYGAGGYAYGDVQRGATYYGPNAPTPYFTGESNGMRSGIVYGGGVEMAAPTARSWTGSTCSMPAA